MSSATRDGNFYNYMCLIIHEKHHSDNFNEPNLAKAELDAYQASIDSIYFGGATPEYQGHMLQMRDQYSREYWSGNR